MMMLIKYLLRVQRKDLLRISYLFAQIAQLVEQRTENPRVTGSIPVLGTVKSPSAHVVEGFFS